MLFEPSLLLLMVLVDDNHRDCFIDTKAELEELMPYGRERPC
jgi:hypothetical protein